MKERNLVKATEKRINLYLRVGSSTTDRDDDLKNQDTIRSSVGLVFQSSFEAKVVRSGVGVRIIFFAFSPASSGYININCAEREGGGERKVGESEEKKNRFGESPVRPGNKIMQRERLQRSRLCLCLLGSK